MSKILMKYPFTIQTREYWDKNKFCKWLKTEKNKNGVNLNSVDEINFDIMLKWLKIAHNEEIEVNFIDYTRVKGFGGSIYDYLNIFEKGVLNNKNYRNSEDIQNILPIARKTKKGEIAGLKRVCKK